MEITTEKSYFDGGLLQLIGWHTKRRCHSTHDNNPELERLDPQRLWIHPEDAAARGIQEGDTVSVYDVEFDYVS